MDEFTQYFKGELDAEEEGGYYQRSSKEDMESLMLAFPSRVQGCRFFQEEEGLFQNISQGFDQIGTVGDTGGGDMPGDGFPKGCGAVDDGLLLTNEISQCMYFPEERTEEAIRYIVCYTRDGIVCTRAGDRRALWKMPFRRTRDYDQVMIFLQNFKFCENLLFSAHKGFWLDYLSGKLDQEGFLDFFARVEHGISNHFLSDGSGGYLDGEIQKYQEYFSYHTITADARMELGDFLDNPRQRLGWRENFQRWKREFVSLFEQEGWMV